MVLNWADFREIAKTKLADWRLRSRSQSVCGMQPVPDAIIGDVPKAATRELPKERKHL